MLSALRLGSSLSCLSAGVGGVRGVISRTRAVAGIRALSTTSARHDAMLSGIPIAELRTEIDSAEALQEFASNIDGKLLHHFIPLMLEHERGLDNEQLVKMITTCISAVGSSPALAVKQLSPLFLLHSFKPRKYSLAHAIQLGRALTLFDELNLEVLEHIKSRILDEADVTELSHQEMSHVTYILAPNFWNDRSTQGIVPRCRDILVAIAKRIAARPDDFSALQCFVMGNQLSAVGCLGTKEREGLENHLTKLLEERDLTFKDLSRFFSATRRSSRNLVGMSSFHNLLVKKCYSFDGQRLVLCLRILSFMKALDNRTLGIVANVMSTRKLVFAYSAAASPVKDSDDPGLDPLQASAIDISTAPGGTASWETPSPPELVFDQQATVAFFAILVSTSVSTMRNSRSIVGMFLESGSIMDFARHDLASGNLLLELFSIFTEPNQFTSEKEELLRIITATDPADYKSRDLLQLLRAANALWSIGQVQLATPLLRYLDQSRFPCSLEGLHFAFMLCRHLMGTAYPLRGVVETVIDLILAAPLASLPQISPIFRNLAHLGVDPKSLERLQPVFDRITSLPPAAAAALPPVVLIDLLWSCLAGKRPIPASLFNLVATPSSLRLPLGTCERKLLQIHAASCGRDDGNGGRTGFTPNALEQLIERLKEHPKSPYHVHRILNHSIAHLTAMFPDGSVVSPVICAKGGSHVPIAVLLDQDGSGVAWPSGSSKYVDAHSLALNFNQRPLAVLPLSMSFFHSDIYQEEGRLPQPNGLASVMVDGLYNCGWDVLVYPWPMLAESSNYKNFLYHLLRSKSVRTDYHPRSLVLRGGKGRSAMQRTATSDGNAPPAQQSRNPRKGAHPQDDASLPCGLTRRALPPSAHNGRSDSQTAGGAAHGPVGGFTRREKSRPAASTRPDDGFVFGQD